MDTVKIVKARTQLSCLTQFRELGYTFLCMLHLDTHLHFSTYSSDWHDGLRRDRHPEQLVFYFYDNNIHKCAEST